MTRRLPVLVCLVAALAAGGRASITARQATLSDRPDTPFKLATIEATGQVRLGLVLGTRVLELAALREIVAPGGVVPSVLEAIAHRALAYTAKLLAEAGGRAAPVWAGCVLLDCSRLLDGQGGLAEDGGDWLEV